MDIRHLVAAISLACWHLLTEDVEWHHPGAYSLSGTYQGRHGVARFLQKIAQDFDILDL
jgi:ketosteroid isomerase-like protein